MAGIRRHLSHAPACRLRYSSRLSTRYNTRKDQLELQVESHQPLSKVMIDDDLPMDVDMDDSDSLSQAQQDSVLPVLDSNSSGSEQVPNEETEPKSRQARVDDVDDEEPCMLYAQPFPDNRRAGSTYGETKTVFQTIRDDQILEGAEVLGPFRDDEEWELAKWLIKNVGHNQTQSFMNLPIVSSSISFSALIVVHLLSEMAD